MNRGARRAPIFETASDARRFLELIGDAIDRTGAEVHAYCLMTNHFHLLVRSPDGSLADFVRHFAARYALTFNQRHGYDGPLFKGRYRSKPVGSDRYLSAVTRYIHRNPLDIRPSVPLDRYRWSSFGAYVGTMVGPGWLTTDVVRELHPSLRSLVEGPPVPVSTEELGSLASFALSERHPDPGVDTMRWDRLLRTALVDHLADDQAAELVSSLGYPSTEALRKGRARARRKTIELPSFADALAHALDIAA